MATIIGGVNVSAYENCKITGFYPSPGDIVPSGQIWIVEYDVSFSGPDPIIDGYFRTSVHFANEPIGVYVPPGYTVHYNLIKAVALTQQFLTISYNPES